MNDIPDFAEAVGTFRGVLSKMGYPDEIFWVFRDDLWQWSPTRIRVKYPTPVVNSSLAQKVYVEGRERGLVEITAVAKVTQLVAATVWYPKFSGQEIQGWSPDLKLAISNPLPDATIVGDLRWWLYRFSPRFQRYQKLAAFIGTREWAAAAA